ARLHEPGRQHGGRREPALPARHVRQLPQRFLLALGPSGYSATWGSPLSFEIDVGRPRREGCAARASRRSITSRRSNISGRRETGLSLWVLTRPYTQPT